MAKIKVALPEPQEPDNPGSDALTPDQVAALAAARAGKASRPEPEPEPKQRRPRQKPQEDNDLAELMTTDFWGSVVAMPFDHRAIAVNFPGYRLTDDERQAVGHPMAVIFRHVVRKYFKKNEELAAAVIAVISVGQLIVSKETSYRAWVKNSGPAPV